MLNDPDKLEEFYGANDTITIVSKLLALLLAIVSSFLGTFPLA